MLVCLISQMRRARFHGCNYKESDRRQGHQSQRSRTLGDDAETTRRLRSGELPNSVLFHAQACVGDRPHSRGLHGDRNYIHPHPSPQILCPYTPVSIQFHFHPHPSPQRFGSIPIPSSLVQKLAECGLVCYEK